MKSLINKWHEAKTEEVTWRTIRRRVEDGIIRASRGYPIEVDGGELRFTKRKKYDLDKVLLHEIAVNNGIENEHERIFTWSLSIKEGEWEKSSQRIKDLFAPAIRVKEGRPTFNFIEKE